MRSFPVMDLCLFFHLITTIYFWILSISVVPIFRFVFHFFVRLLTNDLCVFSEYDVNCQSHLKPVKNSLLLFFIHKFHSSEKRISSIRYNSNDFFEVASKIRILCCNCPMIMTHSPINWKFIDLFLASVHRLQGILLTFPYRITDMAAQPLLDLHGGKMIIKLHFMALSTWPNHNEVNFWLKYQKMRHRIWLSFGWSDWSTKTINQ